jgi:hypothetical protein
MIGLVMDQEFNTYKEQVASQLSQNAVELDNAQKRISAGENGLINISKSLELLTPDVNVIAYLMASFSANARENGAMSLKIKARILKNELVYNRDTWIDVTKASGVTGDATGLEFTSDGVTSTITATFQNTPKSNTKFGLLYTIVNTSISSGSLRVGNSMTGTAFNLPNALGNNKSVFTTQQVVPSPFRIYLSGGIEPAGNKIKLRDMRIFELPAGSEIESDFNTLTADQLAEKYPYVQGQRDTKGGIVRIVNGKNKVPSVSAGSISSSTGLEEPNNAIVYRSGFCFVKPGSVYAISVAPSYVVNGILGYDENGRFIAPLTNSSLISVPINVRKIRLRGRRADSATLTANDIVAVKNSLQLEEGTVATVFQPYSESLIYLPDVGGAVPSAADEVNPVTGEKVVRTKEKVIQTNDVYQVFTGFANIDLVFLKKSTDAIDYNGSITDNNFYIQGYTNKTVSSVIVPLTDNITDIGYASSRNQPLYYVIGVSKGTSLVQAQTALTGKVMRYQLANPITTYLLPQAAKSNPSGSIIWEPVKGEVGFYGTNLAVTDTTLPIKSIIRLYKVNQADGTSTPLDISKAVISSDKLSFTHPDIASGNLADWDYEYDSALSTNPKMEIGYSNGYTGNVTIGTVTLQIKGGVITGVTTS